MTSPDVPHSQSSQPESRQPESSQADGPRNDAPPRGQPEQAPPGSGTPGPRQDRPAAASSPWEWLVGMVGLVLVAGAIGYLGYVAIFLESTPPLVVIEAGQARPDGDGYLVPFTAVNHGDTTAARLGVKGELRVGHGVVESSEVTLDYLPSHSERKGGLYFVNDPSRYQIILHPQGFTEP